MLSNNSFAALSTVGETPTPVPVNNSEKATKKPSKKGRLAPLDALAMAFEAVALEDAELWNQWRWIPEGVFSYSARVHTGCTLPKGPWTCGFKPCGAANRGGKVCFTCFQPRNDDVEMAYSCLGRDCKAKGRSLQFGTVHDMLKHLVSHERFEMAECVHCADAVWAPRLKDHIEEDHPELAKTTSGRGGHGGHGGHCHGRTPAGRTPAAKLKAGPARAVPAKPKPYEELFPAL